MSQVVGGVNVSSFDLSCTQKSFSARLIGHCRVILNASNDLQKLFQALPGCSLITSKQRRTEENVMLLIFVCN